MDIEKNNHFFPKNKEGSIDTYIGAQIGGSFNYLYPLDCGI
jgi:hypothetical protein